MEWYEIEVNGSRSVKFPCTMLLCQNQAIKHFNAAAYKIGGIIKHGEWAWLANESTLHIISLRNGQTISTFQFFEAKCYDSCCIKCVEEIYPNNKDDVLLVVCLEYVRGPGGGSFITLYSVADNSLISCIELIIHITCVCFLSTAACHRSLLQNFDGCLAVGSEEGVVILLNLNIHKLLALHERQIFENTNPMACYIMDYNLPLPEIHRSFQQCQKDDLVFGLRIEVIDTPTAIQCILPIELIRGLAIGLEDGRLVMYDLTELQIFYVAMSPPQQQYQYDYGEDQQQMSDMLPLVKMDFLEPTDDPRSCLYILAMHESETKLTAVLHTFMYERRIYEENSLNYFETFQSSYVRLQLPLESSKSNAIACQSITKMQTHGGEEDVSCLWALTWYSHKDEKNKLLLFDLNQWYKEQMPSIVSLRKDPPYLAAYALTGQNCGLHTYINPTTIAHYNSMQRFEEHFYPNSLSFDCSLLLRESCRNYNWEGAQNRFISRLRCSHAAIFLEPDSYFNEILRTRLLPQFCELNANATFCKNAKFEIILSVALENNCFSLLRDCAKSWMDGSFMGNIDGSSNVDAPLGISLSTLTDWIWKRATDIKKRCNDLCEGIFDCNRNPLDQRQQKELNFISRQQKLLANLLKEVLAQAKRHIPDKVSSNLETKYKSLRMASDYQSILLWLLNIGLLPEALSTSSYSLRGSSCSNNKFTTNRRILSYPYEHLHRMYAEKREFFAKINDGNSYISKKTGSCRMLFIDAFIEHECKGGSALREVWLENNGTGLYPPISIDAMLHVMLVPDISFENKCALLLYFFLDLNTIIDEQQHKHIVRNFIKFPSVFQLSAALIKTVQAFWNLDHGHFLSAVEEFVSPLNSSNQHQSQWQLQLLVESLLLQNAPHLALRVLEARPMFISQVLKLKTLLSNDLISEAFHFARSKHDDNLLEIFFTCCLHTGKYGVIRDLALSEHEGHLVQNILKRSKTHGSDNLHFVYLLQKSKYIEAVSYMDELSNKTKSGRRIGFDCASSSTISMTNKTNFINTPNLVLSAFNTTMTPVTQGLTDVYFRIRNKIKKQDNRSPVPLSCQLIKQNANELLGGIYHSSALSAHFATHYWGEMNKSCNRDSGVLLNSNNAPFLRKPQMENHYLDYLEKKPISYPQKYQIREKRSLAETDIHSSPEAMIDRGGAVGDEVRENPKKRRRLLGEEIIHDLKYFMQKDNRNNTSSRNPNTKEFSLDSVTALQSNDTTDANGMESYLTQPMAVSKRVKSINSPRIHGILKTHTPEPNSAAASGGSGMMIEEERSLRFNLPPDDPRELCDDGDDTDDDDEVIIELQPQQSDNDMDVRQKQITRSVSVESNPSSSSQSDEQFYSPLSSRNTSLVGTAVVNNSGSETTRQQSLTNQTSTYLNGPQLRKPLARLSAERSEKPLTPDTKLSKDLITIFSRNDLAAATELKSEFKVPPTSTSSGSNVIDKTISTTSYLRSDFQPTASSSRISEVQSKLSHCAIPTAEHSTVAGGITYVESTIVDDQVSKRTQTSGIQPRKPITSELRNQHMFDSTLSMSTYDITMVEETREEKLEATIMEISKDVDLYEEALGLRNKSEKEAKKEEKDNASEQNAHKVQQKGKINTHVVAQQYEIEIQQQDPVLVTESIAAAVNEQNDIIELLSSSSSSPSTPSSKSSDVVFSDNHGNANACEEYESDNENEIDNKDDEDGADDEAVENEEEEDQDLDLDLVDEENVEDNVEEGIELDEGDKYSIEASSHDNNDDKGDDTTVCQIVEDSIEIFDENYSNEMPTKHSTELEKNKNNEESNKRSLEQVSIEDLGEDQENQKDILVSSIENIIAEGELPSTSKQIPSETKDIEIRNIQNERGDNDDMDEEDEIFLSFNAEQHHLVIKELNDNEAVVHAHQTLEKSIIEEFNSDVDDDPAANEPHIITTRVIIYEEHEIKIEEMVQEKDDPQNVETIADSEGKAEIESKLSIEELNDDAEVEAHQLLKQSMIEEFDDVDDAAKELHIITTRVIIYEEYEIKIEEMVEEDEDDTNNVETTVAIEEKEDNTTEIRKETQSVEIKIIVEAPPEELAASQASVLNEDDNVSNTDNSNWATTSRAAKRKDNNISEKQEEDENIISHIDDEDYSREAVELIELENLPAKQSENQHQSTSTVNVIQSQIKPKKSTQNSTRHRNATPTVDKRGLRGNSVPPIEMEMGNVSTPRRRNTRGISVPPQTRSETSVESHTPLRTRRTSMKSDDIADDPRVQLRGASLPRTNSLASEASSTGVLSPAKIRTRRTSNQLLNAIAEDETVLLDSPSMRTRSRMRLDSMESELDSSVVSNEPPQIVPLEPKKRTRRTSISSSTSELQQAPKLTRRGSVSSQSVVGETKRKRFNTDETFDADIIEASLKQEEEEEDKKNRQLENEMQSKKSLSLKSEESEQPSSNYSSSRRLTRTQLAIMEKSAAFAPSNKPSVNTNAPSVSTATATTSSSPSSVGQTKRISKRHTSRSTTVNPNQDSEDAESIASSRASNFSGSPTKGRRPITRSSVKDKDEMDDDVISLASSIASSGTAAARSHGNKRRSKEKISPNSTLAAIPENETESPELPKKRGRPKLHH